MMNNQYSGTDVGEVKVFYNEKAGTALNVNEFYGIEVCVYQPNPNPNPNPNLNPDPDPNPN